MCDTAATESSADRHARVSREAIESLAALLQEAERQQFWGEIRVVVGIHGGLAVNCFDERTRKRK